MSARDPVQPDGFPGFCTIEGHDSRSVAFHSCAFDDLHAYLTSHVRVIPVTRADFDALPEPDQDRHKRGPGVVFALFTRDGVRTLDELVGCTALGLDVDEAHVELHVLRALLAGWSVIIYESARSTPAARRWRVIIEYARVLTASEHEQAFEYWAGRIPGVSRSVRDATRLHYALQQFKGSPARIIERLQGDAFEPRDVAARDAAAASRDALRRHIQLPVDMPATDGHRNNTLSRYALSVLRECASEEELLDRCLAQNETYPEPLTESEVRRVIVRPLWRKRAKFKWVPPAVAAVNTTIESEEEGFGFFLDIEAMAATEPSAGYWLVPGWLPGGTVTLYAGDGGSGKSYCSLDMAVCLTAGLSLFGKPTVRTRVMYVSAEDSDDRLHARLVRICAKYGIELRSLAGWLFLRDATRDANVLFSDSKLAGPVWTDRWDVIGDEFQRCGAQLLILDNASDHYDANENERAKVRQFVSGLGAVLSDEQAILLLAHVDAVTAKAGEAGKGYSGSTAWNNSVRSRWYQWRDRETGAITLKLDKSNYGRAGDLIDVRFDEGLGCYTIGEAVQPVRSLDAHAGLVLTLLNEAISRGVNVSAHATTRLSAENTIGKDGRLPKGLQRGAITRLVAKLVEGGYLAEVEVKGRNGRTVCRLELTDRGRAEVA